MLDQLIVVAGWIGTVTLLVAFWLRTMRQILSGGFAYQALNAAGALLLAIATAQTHAWSAAVLNTAWFIIAGNGLLRGFCSRRLAAPKAEDCV